MLMQAAVSRRLSPSRRARRGAFGIDLLFMIILIVAVIGLGVFVMILQSGYQEDELAVRKAEALAAEPYAKFHELKNTAEIAAQPVGFVGNDGMPTTALLDAALSALSQNDAGSRLTFEYLEVEERALGSTSPDENGLKPASDASIGDLVNGLKNVDEKEGIVTLGQSKTVLQLLDQQDRLIDSLGEALTKWNEARARDMRLTADANRALVSNMNAKDSELETTRATHSTEERQNIDAIVASRDDEVTQAREADTYVEEADQRVKRGINRVREDSRELGKARKDVADAARDAAIITSERPGSRAMAGDYLGTVRMVDPDSGWVWIDLGFKDNLRIETPFAVFRRSTDGTGDRKIADIRVKEVLGNRLARCRIDARESLDVLPEPGDGLKNQSFVRRQYKRFAFIGKFGGAHTTYSKQYLINVLREARPQRQIVEPDDPLVEVFVIGGDAFDDPRLERRGSNVTFVPMSEDDLIYLFVPRD